MSNQMESYKRAKGQVEQKIGFYIHLTVYVLANILMITLDFRSSSDTHWFYWPLIGWGVLLAMHTVKVFGSGKGSKIKQRMIERELEREANQNGSLS